VVLAAAKFPLELAVKGAAAAVVSRQVVMVALGAVAMVALAAAKAVALKAVAVVEPAAVAAAVTPSRSVRPNKTWSKQATLESLFAAEVASQDQAKSARPASSHLVAIDPGSSDFPGAMSGTALGRSSLESCRVDKRLSSHSYLAQAGLASRAGLEPDGAEAPVAIPFDPP
jgi:hypothetical protein